MKVLKVTGLLLIFSLLTAGTVIGGNFMSVQVKEGQLRSTPSFLGQMVTEVAYGDRVEVLDGQGKWIKVRHRGKSGWIHESALTEKTIVLSAGRKGVETAASSDELALAGKGFNAQVEKEFKDQNRDIDFTWVDRMEKIVVSAKEMMAFLKAGDVKPREGGGQ